MLSSSAKLILLHKNLKELPKASKYDFVLSPQFYISKIEQLPVKYPFQARKLAPSILEDSLHFEDSCEYIVKKEGNAWQFFAYSPKEIEEFLKSCCGVPPSKIGKIYFADQLKDVLKRVPIGVDETNALTIIDNKATIVPRSMLTSESYAKFTSKLRPKRAFAFKPSAKGSKSSKLNRGAIVTSVLMALLALAFVTEGFSYKSALKQEEAKISDLLNENPSLQGEAIRNSIKSKYEKIEKRERAIRELLSSYSQLTSKKSVLDRLEIVGNKLVAEFSVDSKEINRVLSIAKEAKLKTAKLGGNKIRIEGALK